ncbi:MAG: carboxymuconolactone decarboxylase family protein [Planctomycetota bacterium]
MAKDYQVHISDVDKRLGALFKAAPKSMGAYGQLSQAVSQAGAIDTKTKELMALAISITSRCEDCIAYHCRAVIKHGATEAEVTEAIGVAIEMGGGPAAVYGARAYQAFKDLSA